MKSATYTRRIKNSREIVGVSTVTFGSKNEPTPDSKASWTLIPARRGQAYGLIVDNLRREPESRSRCRAGMVDTMMLVMMMSCGESR